MQFQVLFCEDDSNDPDAVHVDGILHDGTGAGIPVTLAARANGNRQLAAILSAQLRIWADAGAVVELSDGGDRVVLADGVARARL